MDESSPALSELSSVEDQEDPPLSKKHKRVGISMKKKHSAGESDDNDDDGAEATSSKTPPQTNSTLSSDSTTDSMSETSDRLSDLEQETSDTSSHLGSSISDKFSDSEVSVSDSSSDVEAALLHHPGQARIKDPDFQASKDETFVDVVVKKSMLTPAARSLASSAMVQNLTNVLNEKPRTFGGSSLVTFGTLAASNTDSSTFSVSFLVDSAPTSFLDDGLNETRDSFALVHELCTGEEDEEILFSVRGKLFWMPAGSKNETWRERGIGTLRLNSYRNEKNKRGCRLGKPLVICLFSIVMRCDGSLRVTLNVLVTRNSHPCIAQERFVQFLATEDGCSRRLFLVKVACFCLCSDEE